MVVIIRVQDSCLYYVHDVRHQIYINLLTLQRNMRQKRLERTAVLYR